MKEWANEQTQVITTCSVKVLKTSGLLTSRSRCCCSLSDARLSPGWWGSTNSSSSSTQHSGSKGKVPHSLYYVFGKCMPMSIILLLLNPGMTCRGSANLTCHLPVRAVAALHYKNRAFNCVYIYISEKRCVLGTMLLMNSNSKPYTIFRMVPLSMTLSDLWPRFQGHDIFEVTAGWCKTVQYCKVDQESWHDDSTFIISTHQSTWPTSSKTTTHLAPCDQLINCYCLYHGWH